LVLLFFDCNTIISLFSECYHCINYIFYFS
jgi:hypothetical protein